MLGWMSEWLKVSVLKTEVSISIPGVQIPLRPQLVKDILNKDLFLKRV
jgi:hypothetical protein